MTPETRTYPSSAGSGSNSSYTEDVSIACVETRRKTVRSCMRIEERVCIPEHCGSLHVFSLPLASAASLEFREVSLSHRACYTHGATTISKKPGKESKEILCTEEQGWRLCLQQSCQTHLKVRAAAGAHHCQESAADCCAHLAHSSAKWSDESRPQASDSHAAAPRAGGHAHAAAHRVGAIAPLKRAAGPHAT